MAQRKLYLSQVMNGHELVGGVVVPTYKWKVVKTVNSVKPKIGEYLTESQVETLCFDETWNVEIV